MVISRCRVQSGLALRKCAPTWAAKTSCSGRTLTFVASARFATTASAKLKRSIGHRTKLRSEGRSGAALPSPDVVRDRIYRYHLHSEGKKMIFDWPSIPTLVTSGLIGDHLFCRRAGADVAEASLCGCRCTCNCNTGNFACQLSVILPLECS